MQFDLLGDQLMLALQFLRSGFNRALAVQDEIAGEKVETGQLFVSSGDHWSMRSESVPGYLAIKAIGLDPENLYLETSPLDIPAVLGVIGTRKLPLSYIEAKHTFVYKGTSGPVVTISDVKFPEIDGVKLGARCLWTIRVKGVSDATLETSITLADAVYSAEAFQVESLDEEEERNSQPGKISLKLQLKLRHTLALEQRPILSVTLADQMKPALHTELRQILAVQQVILRLNPQQLADYVDKYAQEHGEKGAVQMLDFVLAGRVKNVRSDLTWKEARRIARSLSFRESA